MSISKAIREKNKQLLRETVAKAVKKYNAAKPEVPQVETCNGPMDLTMAVAVDKKQFWVHAIQAYTEIVNTPIAKGDDKEVEVAKSIASNAVLRALADKPENKDGGLL